MSFTHSDKKDSQESSAIKKGEEDPIDRVQPCSVCVNMDMEAWKEQNKQTFYYSDAHEAAAKGCRFCRCVCAILDNYFQLEKVKPHEAEDIIAVKYRQGEPIFSQRWGTSTKQIMVYTPHGCAKPWNSCRAAGGEVNPIAGSDDCLGLASKWMSACLLNHDSCKQLNTSKLPRRIIDIGRGQDQDNLKLREDLDISSPYAALSHCWGQHRPMTTTTSNLELRKQGIQWDSMPPTFKDAVIVARRLSLRYLWIDSLCVIQNDVFDWQTESAKMGGYYHDAQIVIAAGSSLDATHSFLAPRRNEVSNPFEQDVQRGDGVVSKVRARPLVETGLSLEPLDKRAWTFQEQYLATRLLRYTDQEMTWTCQTESRCECNDVHTSIAMDLSHSAIWGRYCASDSQIATKDAAFIAWQALIFTYSRRELTRQSDKLPAISGVAAIIQRTTGSSYVAGLWRDNLLRDLCWKAVPLTVAGTNISVTADLQDPNTYGFFKLRMPPQYRAPSFSWASIDFVPVDYSNRGTYNDDFDPSALVLQTECIVKGVNKYGEVADGFIVLEALLIEADLKVKCESSGATGFYTVERNGMTTYMQADLPLVLGSSLDELGHKKSTVKRASAGDDIAEFAEKVMTLVLGRAGKTYAVLVLGASVSTRGAYERLGIIEFHLDGYQQCSIQEWFEDAKQSVVTVV